MSYRMELQTLDFLVSQPGQDLLGRLQEEQATRENSLELLTRLRKEYPRDRATAALDLTLLRVRAQSKFSRAHQMYFTREALEQASSGTISAYRARRFASYSSASDLGCGIGGDALHLAQYAHVVAIERDALRQRMAELNARVYGVSDRIDFVHADFTEMDLPLTQAVFLDPSRRAMGERVYSIYDYEPPLSILHKLLTHTSNIAAKISPGVRYNELHGLGLDCELEFISENDTCKEAVLWLGDLKAGCLRRATILPQGASITDSKETDKVAVEPPRGYLYNPDGAVVRAHLVEHLASLEGLSKIDDHIAYLTSDRLVRTPFAKALEVEEVHPFNLKRLNERLRELRVGYVTIMKRGSPIQPESFRRRLRLEGNRGRILVFTTVKDEPSMLICSDVP
jgi:SAM-dependent methyltransferase